MIRAFPGTVAELAQYLSEEKPQAAVMVHQDETGLWHASWSTLDSAQLVLAHRLLGLAIDRILVGEEPLR